MSINERINQRNSKWITDYNSFASNAGYISLHHNHAENNPPSPRNSSGDLRSPLSQSPLKKVSSTNPTPSFSFLRYWPLIGWDVATTLQSLAETQWKLPPYWLRRTEAILEELEALWLLGKEPVDLLHTIQTRFSFILSIFSEILLSPFSARL